MPSLHWFLVLPGKETAVYLIGLILFIRAWSGVNGKEWVADFYN
jgi:hypothetical protein